MGMFFGGLDEDEYNQPSADNFVYKQLKKARYKSIELCEGDIITNSFPIGEFYTIRDFKENGCPVVHLVSNNCPTYQDFEWNFSELFIITPILSEFN